MRGIISIAFIFSSIIANAQLIPLDQSVQSRLNELLENSDTSIFTGFRGMNWLELKQLGIIKKTELMDSAFGISPSSNTNVKQLTTDNWVKATNSKNIFTIDPYIEATLGQSNDKNGMLANLSGGLRFQDVLNDKLSFNFDIITNYNQYPLYIDSVIHSKNNIIPGQNAATVGNNNRFSNTYPNFNVTYIPNRHLLISAGFGKQFIGDGYRSLFLSDNSFNYPYVRLQARFWKITYNVLYNEYVNKFWYTVNGESQKKFSTIHYIGVNISKKFQMALFDNIIWLSKDTNMHRGFDVQYLNPLIFMRPIEFSLGSPDNAMIGITWKYSAFKNSYFYGQICIDDLDLTLSIDNRAQYFGNKYALQAGVWIKDIFHVNGLSYRFEWNGVRPYTYGHGVGNNISLNYTQYYQPLADPFGANFHEFISIFNYHSKRWYGTIENLFTIRGENPGLPYNNGENLWGGEQGVPAFGSTTLQGIKTYYFYNQLSAGFLINPRNRLTIEADVAYRKRSSTIVDQSEFFYSVGIRTNLFNFYRDF